MAKPLQISFSVDKGSIRTFKFQTPIPHEVRHIYPTLTAYQARKIPDHNNPRSHDSDDLVKTRISRKIRETIEKEPGNFKLRNKGGLIIAHNFNYDDETGIATIELLDHEVRYSEEKDEIRPLHGLADGGTTDRIIYEMQQANKFNAALEKAQWHLEVVVFNDNSKDEDFESKKREVITDMSEARNTSQQVKGWSINDLKGDWNWLKKVLNEHYDDEFVAYDEYAKGKITVLDILAILNLFHPYYVGSKAPTSSYSSKGTMLKKFENRDKGFVSLTPVLLDLLELHDYVYSTFNDTYAKLGTKKSLRRYAKEGDKVFEELEPPRKLLFSNHEADLEVHKGLLFPILASFRALLDFSENNPTAWFTEPKAFWDEHGPGLINRLLDTLIQYKNNPQTCGKDPNLYRNLYDAVESIRSKEEVQRLKERLSKEINA